MLSSDHANKAAMLNSAISLNALKNLHKIGMLSIPQQCEIFYEKFNYSTVLHSKSLQ